MLLYVYVDIHTCTDIYTYTYTNTSIYIYIHICIKDQNHGFESMPSLWVLGPSEQDGVRDGLVSNMLLKGSMQVYDMLVSLYHIYIYIFVYLFIHLHTAILEEIV